MSVAVVRTGMWFRGAVQGVGFRPFVYRWAQRMALSGWVENTPEGVRIEVEGPEDAVSEFSRRLRSEAPRRAHIQAIETSALEPRGPEPFVIRASAHDGVKSAVILPDAATCEACLCELLDPSDRRFQYPFINCTDCGPRYSIILGLPYDRSQTTMSGFAMCDVCTAEYGDPASRRFHAEPIACPECGPHLELWAPDGRSLSQCDQALRAVADVVRAGGIVAVKQWADFKLVADARNDDVVRKLRTRKGREEKPFAVMVRSLADVRTYAEVSPEEEVLLSGHQAPIVLLRRRADGPRISDGVAPGNPYLGVMLPTTPMHHLLLRDLVFPVVATSGNRSDEPICVDEHDALWQLRGIADVFLVHDRPIARYIDDSVVRMVAGREMVLRRARGYAPLPVAVFPDSKCVLAVGAHTKATVAVVAADQVILSPHIGDLGTESALEAFQHTIDTLVGAYQLSPVAVVCDTHPDYASTQWARKAGRPLLEIQHHYAHVLAGMADNEIGPPVLGVAWDGSGLGLDGTIWGGEFLRVGGESFDRVAHLRPFLLPGGERAVREPRRSAAGALFELVGGRLFEDDRLRGLFSEAERPILAEALQKGLNCPITSSAGRLFDAVAALVGLCPVASFEGQAAMALEYALPRHGGDEAYPFELALTRGVWVLDWGPIVREVQRDAQEGRDVGTISLRFHNALAEMIVGIARKTGQERIVLTGGCFQNRYLAERAIDRLQQDGFRPYWHRQIPPNDGGIAVGQALAALLALRER